MPATDSATEKVNRIRDYARDKLIVALPEYEVMVRHSDNPEDYGKFVDRLTKLAGIRDETERDNLPIFNITIAAGAVKAEQVDVVEVLPTPQAAQLDAPSDPAPEPDPAVQPFVLNIAPIE